MSEDYSYFSTILKHISKELEKKGLKDASYLTALASHSISGTKETKNITSDIFFNNNSNKELIKQ